MEDNSKIHSRYMHLKLVSQTERPHHSLDTTITATGFGQSTANDCMVSHLTLLHHDFFFA